MEMNLVANKLKEGQKMTWAHYQDELNYTVKAPLKVMAEHLFLLAESVQNPPKGLHESSMTLETILSRWENLEVFFCENRKEQTQSA